MRATPHPLVRRRAVGPRASASVVMVTITSAGFQAVRAGVASGNIYRPVGRYNASPFPPSPVNETHETPETVCLTPSFSVD